MGNRAAAGLGVFLSLGVRAGRAGRGGGGWAARDGCVGRGGRRRWAGELMSRCARWDGGGGYRGVFGVGAGAVLGGAEGRGGQGWGGGCGNRKGGGMGARRGAWSRGGRGRRVGCGGRVRVGGRRGGRDAA